jgi:FkbM family methyltransferase
MAADCSIVARADLSDHRGGRHMKPPTRITFCAAAALLPCAALVHVARVHHASLVLSHYAAGRAGNCTLAESFQGEGLSRLQAANVDEIRASSRVVRQDGPYALLDTPLGQYWVPAGSRDALTYDLSEQKRNIYGNRIRPGDIVLDAGASVGVFTRKALGAGAAKVIAIEPAPENIECLRRNFSAEIANGRVVIYPKGIWDKDDVLKLAIDPHDSAQDTFVRALDGPEYIEAPLTTVDRLVRELGLPRVDFIKMDIEGAERKAIVGARNAIAQFRPRMALCIYHLAGDETAIPKLVREAYSGYRVSKTCLCGADKIVPEVAFFY